MGGRLRHGRALAAALALGVAACGGGSGGPVGPGPVVDADADGLVDAAELDLLLQFRPVWAFDADEEIWPISVEEWAEAGGSVVRGATRRAYGDLAGLLAAVLELPDGTMETAEEIRRGDPPCLGAGAGCDLAPVYVDAIPVPFQHAGRRNLVWLHYWLFYHHDTKALQGVDLSHHGDWEHVCVLVSLDDLGRADAPPVGLHFHHHGSLTVSDAAAAWHADPACSGGTTAPGCLGSHHPRVYVEANGHASFRDAGETLLGPHFGEILNAADQLDNPLVFLTPHGTNEGTSVDEVVRGFRGRWGQTPEKSPFGPLVPTQPCDHDYDASPSLQDWLPACRDS